MHHPFMPRVYSGDLECGVDLAAGTLGVQGQTSTCRSGRAINRTHLVSCVSLLSFPIDPLRRDVVSQALGPPFLTPDSQKI